MRVQGPTFSSRLPSAEWYDVDYLKPAASRRGTAIPLLAALWIAAVDLGMARTNLSILYVIPLILFAWHEGAKSIWRAVGVLWVLTFGVYFLKNTIFHSAGEATYFNSRLVNRCFVAIMLAVLAKVLQLWIRWRHEQRDAEVSDSLRQEEQEIGAMLAVLYSAPLLALIAVVDFFAPANYNVAILYPIPLFICAWTRSRPLLWGMLAVMLLLTAIAFVFGTPSFNPGLQASLTSNRVLVALGLVAITTFLTLSMKWDRGHSPGD